MDPITLGTAAAGLVGGLFVKKRPRNPFAAQINQQTQTLSDASGRYGGMAAAARNRYDTFRPQADAALNDQVDYLKQDPFTDQVSTQVLGRATAGTNTAYNAAKANLAASIARRGLSGDSSAQIGGDAAIESARAGDFSSAENDLAMRRLDTRRSNLSTLTGLLGGVAENERGNAIDVTGRQAGLSGDLLRFYAGQNSEANADNDADYNRQLSGTSSLGGLAGGALGGRGRVQNPFAPASDPFYPTLDGSRNGDGGTLSANSDGTPPFMPEQDPTAPTDYGEFFPDPNPNAWANPYTTPVAYTSRRRTNPFAGRA